VRWYGNGVFGKSPQLGSSIAAKSLNQVEPGDVVYSKLFAWKGSFGVVTSALPPMVASTEFPTYTPRPERLLAGFFEIWASRPEIWGLAADASTGTTANSRNRFSTEDFLDLEIELPPLAEQHAIVEATDRGIAAISAWTRELMAATRAQAVARLALIENSSHERVPMEELVTGVRGGKSPQCLSRRPVDGEYGVLKVSAIRQGEFRSAEAKALPDDAPRWDGALHAGDLVYSRANTTSLVGVMCRVERDHPHLLLCDKTMRVTVDPLKLDPHFLVEAVATPSAREHIEMMAGGTSASMKNISQGDYLETEIPLPPLDEQKWKAALLGQLKASAVAAQQRIDQTRRLQGAIVEDLVTGVRRAPDAT